MFIFPPTNEGKKMNMLVVSCDRNTPASEPDGRVSVLDEAGQPASINDNVAAGAAILPLFGILSDHARRLLFKIRKSPAPLA
jgi:hypothetical protein